MSIGLIFGIAVLASAAAPAPLELVDASGPTGLQATVVDARDDSLRLAVTSRHGYATMVTSTGYFILHSGWIRLASDCSRPLASSMNVPGAVLRVDQRPEGSPSTVYYIPRDAILFHLAAGTTVYGHVFEPDGDCVEYQLPEAGDYYEIVPNDPTVTGVPNALQPPLRLRPFSTAGAACVFQSGFECAP
jgi:hypothetical protein